MVDSHILSTPKGKKLLVWFPLGMLALGMIGVIVVLSIQSTYDYGWTYRHKLAQIYNKSQGAADHYLDRLHEQFACCGVTGMELDITNDTNVFVPAYGMYTRLPKSCCPTVEKHQNCSSNDIYPVPCDLRHYDRVKLFDYITVPLLAISLAWKIAMIFIYQNNENTLLD